jgi:hypothetical protein
MNKYSDSNSSYWLDADFFQDDTMDILGEEVSKPKGKDPVKLAGYRRAIGNFVRIVTGLPIPVRFTSQGDSFTDGTTVTISASLKDKDFDSAVGLALHEGSHIRLTDFNILKDLENWIQRDDEYMMHLAKKHKLYEMGPDGLTDKPDRWRTSAYVMNNLKNLINIIEDRRIDHWVYKNAPGYRGYYEALYDKYFNAKIIDKGLQSDEYTELDWESYIFRICNITNPNRRLDVLDLMSIWKMLDLKNIARLKETEDVRDLAWKIFKFIESKLPEPKFEESETSGEDQDEKGQEISDEQFDEILKDIENGDVKDDGSKADGEEAEKGGGGSKGNAKMPELSDRQKHQLQKAIEKQKEFMDEKTKKTKVSKSMQKQMKAMENSGVSVENVEYEQERWSGDGFKRDVDVTVIKNFTKDLVNNIECGMWIDDSWQEWKLERHNNWVKEGIRRGVVLGKKLKVRAEERNTKFNRLRSGKIDKRMIANAGFGAEGIFEKIENFAYNPGIIHISIDNSGSMNGSRFQNAVTTAVAVAKACSMIENMDCVISFRASSFFVDTSRNSERPIILIAYDSRRHGMAQIKTMMPYVDTAGLTPEGLCFDAIMKEILDSSRGKDAYFVNFSDGQPYFNSYSGESAEKHTRQQVKKMTRDGIKVISYFIDGRSDGRSADCFRKMYGKESQFINVNKIADVAKSMNNKFLEVI